MADLGAVARRSSARGSTGSAMTCTVGRWPPVMQDAHELEAEIMHRRFDQLRDLPDRVHTNTKERAGAHHPLAVQAIDWPLYAPNTVGASRPFRLAEVGQTGAPRGSANRPGCGPRRGPCPRSGWPASRPGAARQSRPLGRPAELGAASAAPPASSARSRVVGGEAQLAARRQQPRELGDACPGLTIRRLWWRAFGQGSGNRTKMRSRQASGRARSRRRASSTRTRMLSRRSRRRPPAAWPRRHEGLAADEADIGMRPPPARPDARRRRSRSPARGRSRRRKQLRRIELARSRAGAEPKLRQALVQQPPAPPAAAAWPCAAAVDLPADRGWRRAARPAPSGQNAPRSSSARSVRSQEKPPSASGSRPKWP